MGKVPQPVLFISPVPVKAVKVAAGLRSAFCLTDDGDIYSWGGNDGGETGHPKRSVPDTSLSLDVSFPTRLDLTTRFRKLLQIPTNERIKVLDVVAGSNHAILLVRNETTMMG
jgi:alpha-tubulin suppressor-like RCC1 family protein